METTDDLGPAHPVEGFVRAAGRDLAALAEQPLWTLDAARSRALVRRLAGLAAQVAELETRAIVQARDAGALDEDGARSLRSWLKHQTQVSGAEASRKARLVSVGEQTRAALARGEVHAEQALVITAAVAELDDVLPTEQQRAEKHLLGEASHHDADDLRVLGRRILEHLDPARADEHEARLLEKQEARARKTTRMRLWDDGDGLVHGSFTMPSAQGSMLRKALQALAAPKHVRATEGAGAFDHEKPTPSRLGEAFVEYVERYPTDRLPSMGGISATVVAVVDWRTLHDQYVGDRAAHLDTGVAISPGEARRWACSAGVLPAVMDGPSKLLDLGRRRRFHSPAQRIALTVTQRHCQQGACDVPAAFCHVHHRVPWEQGGRTDLADADLLCPFHHHQLHASGAAHPLRT